MFPVSQDQCLMYADCSTMQGQCFAQCVNDPNATCQQIAQAVQGQSGPVYDCAQSCQGMTTTTSTGTTMSTGTGMMQTCGTCVQNSCQQELGACFQTNPQECNAWVQCAQMCMDQACTDACTAAHPVNANMMGMMVSRTQAVQDCSCMKCPMQCAATCN